MILKYLKIFLLPLPNYNLFTIQKKAMQNLKAELTTA